MERKSKTLSIVAMTRHDPRSLGLASTCRACAAIRVGMDGIESEGAEETWGISEVVILAQRGKQDGALSSNRHR
jgi:hypothetical protein